MVRHSLAARTAARGRALRAARRGDLTRRVPSDRSRSSGSRPTYLGFLRALCRDEGEPTHSLSEVSAAREESAGGPEFPEPGHQARDAGIELLLAKRLIAPVSFPNARVEELARWRSRHPPPASDPSLSMSWACPRRPGTGSARKRSGPICRLACDIRGASIGERPAARRLGGSPLVWILPVSIAAEILHEPLDAPHSRCRSRHPYMPSRRSRRRVAKRNPASGTGKRPSRMKRSRDAIPGPGMRPRRRTTAAYRPGERWPVPGSEPDRVRPAERAAGRLSSSPPRRETIPPRRH